LSAREFHQLLDVTRRLIESSKRAVKLKAYFAGETDTSTNAHIAGTGKKRRAAR
jgi:hypothetical protein